MTKKKIFILENDPEILTVMDLILREQYDLRLYDKPTDSILQEIREEQPDIIIIDWLIPNFHTEDLIDPIKISAERAKILIISAHNSVKQAFVNKAIDKILQKPFGARELRSTIKQLLLENDEMNKKEVF